MKKSFLDTVLDALVDGLKSEADSIDNLFEAVREKLGIDAEEKQTDVSREALAKAWDSGFYAARSPWVDDHVNPYREVPETDDENAPPPCEGHLEVQHRDGNPPWCRKCGWSHAKQKVTTAKKYRKMGL